MATILAAVAAATTLAGGRAAAQAQAKQAAHARLQARQNYLQYKQQGIQILDEMLNNAATINAYAGAGGIDVTSGSPDRIASFNLAKGITDLTVTQEAGQMALRGGVLQAEQQMQAAKATRLNAFAQSVGQAAQGVEAYERLSR